MFSITCERIDAIAENIKMLLNGDDILCSVDKFVTTYEKLSSKPSNAHVTSALHKFGWCFGGTVTRMQGGVLRRGRRIPIQAKSAGRRKNPMKWGKAVAAPGHVPKAAFTKQLPKDNSNYFLPLRPHNSSIIKKAPLTKTDHF